jgi:alpha-beta hydrolase superfamily lysophospholipase
MPDPVVRDFAAGEGAAQVPLFLRQMVNPDKPPVLLLHGASARSESFRIPGPDLDDNPRSLADWLFAKGFEPWLLDWRGSCAVVDAAQKSGILGTHADVFDFDHAARHDIPGALRVIREHRPDAEWIGAVGHCMGAGTLAQALAEGHVSAEEHGLRRVVLLTLGLFYQATYENQLKARDATLEQLRRQRQAVLAVDARRPVEEWPRPLATLYDNVARAREPHRDATAPAYGICNRLTFMYGAPYVEDRLVPEIHRDAWTLRFRAGCRRPEIGDVLYGADSTAEADLAKLELQSGAWRRDDAAGLMTLFGGGQLAFRPGEDLLSGGEKIATLDKARFYEAQLPCQFGSIPLRMYEHGARNVRRGWAGCYGDRSDCRLIEPQRARDFLRGLESVTLITGSENRLWHPRGIGLMHEWLLNSGREAREICRRHVVPGFGHQDLLWGADARDHVFPSILEGLGG